ncbi:MAG: hypothetical protein DA407_00115 [Bacteroidetes bacterium]|nr:MAG: hypothetical protein DA407_00115 [Bacteroidota bacterium]
MKLIRPFLILIIVTGVFSCKEKPLTKIAKLQTLIDSIYKAHPNGVGFILHVEAPDQNISWGSAVGYSNRQTKETLNKEQPGQIASITKTFVSATIFRLIENGDLNMYEPIRTLVPEKTRVLMIENGYDLDSITVAHLLSHRGGFPSMVTKKWREILKQNLQYTWTRDEQIKDALSMNERLKIGDFEYSDLNYSLLSEIIEEKTETSFFLAMRNLLKFDEIGLNNTWFYSLEPDPKGIEERFHQYKESRNWVSTFDESPTWGLFGAAGLVSTTEDLAIFSQALTTGNIFNNPETLSLMLSDLKGLDNTFEDIGYDMEFSMRMGIDLIKGQDFEIYGFNGYWGGYMYHFPELNASFGLYQLNADEEIDIVKLFLDIKNIIE